MLHVLGEISPVQSSAKTERRERNYKEEGGTTNEGEV